MSKRITISTTLFVDRDEREDIELEVTGSYLPPEGDGYVSPTANGPADEAELTDIQAVDVSTGKTFPLTPAELEVAEGRLWAKAKPKRFN